MSTLLNYYDTGTVSILNGHTTVTGVGTSWLPVIRSGDVFWINGQGDIRVASITDNTHLELADNWAGTDQSAVAYEIRMPPPSADVTAGVRAVVESLVDGLIYAIEIATPANFDILQYVSGVWTPSSVASMAASLAAAMAFPTGGTAAPAINFGGTSGFSDATGTGNVIASVNALRVAAFVPTGIGLRSSGAAHDLILSSSEVVTADRTLSFVLNDANKTVSLAGNLTTAGAYALTLTQSGATNVTLPTTGTLATLANAEALTNKTINFSLNTITNIATSMFAANVVDTDTTLAANSDTRLASQKATKAYFDNGMTGLAWKAACLVATTANITLSGEQTIDGVLTSASRVLVKAQSTPSQNGIYVSAAGAWARSSDTSTGAELVNATTFIEEGTVASDTQWTCTTNPTITVGSTSIAFAQVAGAGTYTSDGSTITLTGNSFAVTANGITYAKLQQVAASSLVGNATGSLANATGITLGAALTFSGSALQTAAMTGDVTASANSFATTVAKIAGVAVGTPTGTGNVVFSASPTFSGTAAFAGASFSSAITYGGVTLANSVLGTGSMMLSSTISTDGTMAANSATLVPSQSAVSAYVAAAILGMTWKSAVACISLSNITLSGEQTIDGVLTSASRVLVAGQSTQTQNGIYVSAAGAWARSSDANTNVELANATAVVEGGTLNKGSQWTVTNATLTIGVTNINIVQIAASGASISAGTGLSLSGISMSIAANGVTYSLFQQVAASSLVGNATGSLANATGITLGAALTFSGSALQTAAMTGDVTAAANSFVTTVAKIAGTTVSGVTGTGNVVFSSAIAPFTGMSKIINGGMVLDQRNAGATSVPTASAYVIDRWVLGLTQSSKITIGQDYGGVSPPVGFAHYLGAKVTTTYAIGAGDAFDVTQRIEGLNCTDLNWGTANAKSITISFWFYSDQTSTTWGGAIQNSAVNRSYPFTFSANVASTWTYVTVTIPGDTSGTWLTTNGVGLIVILGMGVGSTLSGTAGAWAGAAYYSATGAKNIMATSNALFYITGVKLETGSVATPYVEDNYGVLLSKCQRYFEKSNDIRVLPGANASGIITTGCSSGGTTTAYCFGSLQYKVSKRVAPTLTFYDSAGTPGKVTRTNPGVANYDGNNAETNSPGENGIGSVYSDSGSSASGIIFNFKADAEL